MFEKHNALLGFSSSKHLMPYKRTLSGNFINTRPFCTISVLREIEGAYDRASLRIFLHVRPSVQCSEHTFPIASACLCY